MITPQFLLPLHHELVIDLFAGGGGASTGIEQATGRAPDVAINHDPETVSLHQANHPQTAHYVSDVFEVEPLTVTQGRAVGLMWASPDCKHFSKAKGGKPVSKRVRGLAWVVVKWAKLVRPRVICLENVEEFQTWGPLLEDGRPCPQRKGKTFARWVAQLRDLGYVVEWRELRACDYGAPTIRKRLFLVARCDGAPIVWPQPTYAAPDSLLVKARKLQPWRAAAQCIDWSIPAPSIFERTKPLADATCRRIAKGIMRYVVDAAEPFIVPVTHQGGDRVEAVSELMRTITGAHRGEKALAVPTIISMGHGERAGQQPRVPGVERPHSTITAQGQHSALVTGNLLKLRGDNIGSTATQPLHTISAQGLHHAAVQAFMVKYYGSDQGQRLRDPLHTITTHDRFGLVTVHGQPYAIVDIGLRMLTPRELYLAQGFPPDYRIDSGADGRPLTKTAQVRMCGNSVCPPLARALVAANYVDVAQARRAA